MNTGRSVRIGICALLAFTISRAALATEKVSVRLNWVPGTEHAFLYLGKEKGWFADAGIDLEIIAGQGSTVAIKTVGAGETTFAIADVATWPARWEAGVPISRRGGTAQGKPDGRLFAQSQEHHQDVGSLRQETRHQHQEHDNRAVSGNAAHGQPEGLRDHRGADRRWRSQGSDVGSGRCRGDLLLRRAGAAAIKGPGAQPIAASHFFKLYSLSIITNIDTATHKGRPRRFLRQGRHQEHQIRACRIPKRPRRHF